MSGLGAITRTRHDVVVAAVLKVFDELGFVYVRGGNGAITEFEVHEPSRFRVMVEASRREKASLFVGHSTEEETHVQIHRDLELDQGQETVASDVSLFLDRLIANLPNKPWEGLGFVRSKTEKAKWMELRRI